MGWFAQSALLAHRRSRDFAFDVTDSVIETAPGRAEIRLTDAVAHIAVTLAFMLDPDSDVLTVSTTLTNAGDAPLDVQWLAAAYPAPAG